MRRSSRLYLHGAKQARRETPAPLPTALTDLADLLVEVALMQMRERDRDDPNDDRR